MSFLNELQNWEGLYSSCLFTENSLLICILLFKYRKAEVGAYVFCDSGAYPALWAASVGRCVPKIPCYPVLVVLLPGPTSVNAKGAEKPRKVFLSKCDFSKNIIKYFFCLILTTL